MEKMYVGIYVGKDDFKVVAKNDANEMIMPVRTYSHDRPGFEAFDRDIESLVSDDGCELYFGMESTGIYHDLLHAHLLQGHRSVRVFNGLELTRYKSSIRKTKTDALDAEAIAEALVLNHDASYPASSCPHLLDLREHSRLRSRLLEKSSECKVQAIRCLDILCRGYSDVFSDVFCPSSVAVLKLAIRKTRLFRASTEQLFQVLRPYMARSLAETKAARLRDLFDKVALNESMTAVSILELHMLLQQHELLSQQLARIEKKIKGHVQTHNPHILSIPGVSGLTAGVILGELGDLHRFSTPNQLTAYAGLDPSVKESGRSRKTGRISKRGSATLRCALYKASLPAIQHNPVCKQFYERLRSKGKHHKVCRIAVARQLLHIAYSVELNQRDFYVPSYASSCTLPEPADAITC